MRWKASRSWLVPVWPSSAYTWATTASGILARCSSTMALAALFSSRAIWVTRAPRDLPPHAAESSPSPASTMRNPAGTITRTSWKNAQRSLAPRCSAPSKTSTSKRRFTASSIIFRQSPEPPDP